MCKHQAQILLSIVRRKDSEEERFPLSLEHMHPIQYLFLIQFLQCCALTVFLFSTFPCLITEKYLADPFQKGKKSIFSSL